MKTVMNLTQIGSLKNCKNLFFILLLSSFYFGLSAQQLDIISDIAIPARISSNNNNLALRLDYNNGNPGFEFFVNSSDGFNICESGVACGRFFIAKTTGNIGIGTSTPSAKLDVNGDAEINQVTVGRGPGNNAFNTALGIDAMSSNVVGVNLTGIGRNALRDANSEDNTAVGTFVLEKTTTGSRNVAVGISTLNANTSGLGQTAVGWRTLQFSTGNRNAAFGESSLGLLSNGELNCAFGYSTLLNNTTGSRNTVFGSNAGLNNTGSDNIFLGYNAGANETGSNKLYIDNTNTSTPLIHGDFASNELTVNGTMHISETAKLEPLSTAPSCAASDEGTIYYDNSINKLRVCNGTTWINLH